MGAALLFILVEKNYTPSLVPSFVAFNYLKYKDEFFVDRSLHVAVQDLVHIER